MPFCKIFNTEGKLIEEFSTEGLGQTTGIRIGRSGICEISLKKYPEVDASVGRVHVELSRRDDGWWASGVHDRGIRKDGLAVDDVLLKDGEFFRFGNCAFAVGAATQPSDFNFFYETNVGHVECCALWEGVNTLGVSSRCSVTLHDAPTCSRQHANINVRGKTVTIEDIGSNNGTKVNGKKVLAETVLTPGEDFYLGKVKAWIDRKTSADDYLQHNTIWRDKYFRLFVLLVIIMILNALKNRYF